VVSGEGFAGAEEEREVAWLAMPERAPVISRDGEEIGRLDGVLADPADDIFHGIVVKLRGGRRVQVEAGRLAKITTVRILTQLSNDEVEQLPEYAG
jgi:hypothetical protein